LRYVQLRSFAQMLAHHSGRLYSLLSKQQRTEEAEAIDSLSHERFFFASQSQGSSDQAIQISSSRSFSRRVL
jgi:hypothetical protein